LPVKILEKRLGQRAFSGADLQNGRAGLGFELFDAASDDLLDHGGVFEKVLTERVAFAFECHQISAPACALSVRSPWRSSAAPCMSRNAPAAAIMAALSVQ